MARHGESIEDISVGENNTLPLSGTFHATVTLRPTTSTTDHAAVERAIADLFVDASDSAQVWANGVEICSGDGGGRTQHLALRERLLASTASPAGALACEDGYAGALADLTADIAVVRSAIAAVGALEDLRIDGRISARSGEVSGLWRALPTHLVEALGTFDATDVNLFDLVGADLEVDVQPGLDGDRVRAAVAAVVPEISRSVTRGGAHGAEASLPPAAAQLRSDLGALPGVESVRFVSARQIVVRDAVPTDVAPTVAAGRPLVLPVAPTDVHVTTHTSDTPQWTVGSGADFEVGADAAAASRWHVRAGH